MANQGYRSLYGERNPERNFKDFSEVDEKINQLILSKKRGIKIGSLGGSTTDLRMFRKLSDAKLKSFSGT